MAFTDNQVEQMKKDPNHQGVHTCDGRCGLIRRMEAAEAVIRDMGNDKWDMNLMLAWLKAAGKDGSK